MRSRGFGKAIGRVSEIRAGTAGLAGFPSVFIGYGIGGATSTAGGEVVVVAVGNGSAAVSGSFSTFVSDAEVSGRGEATSSSFAISGARSSALESVVGADSASTLSSSAAASTGLALVRE